MATKANNKNLSAAKKVKNDEFYTPLSYIEKELKHYREFLRGKIVFCNCDDPVSSNFWKYFASNFEFLGLKKLISTHYETDKPSYKLELSGDVDGDGKITTLDRVQTNLSQNGDFRSPECIDILKDCDVVITNPPFSLFREYLAQLVEYEKNFLIIGSLNAITYKETMMLIMDNKVWLGVNSGATEFEIPDGTKQKFGNICWFTNIPVENPPEPLKLYKKYNPTDYPKYDNYEGINVDKVVDIPCDYFEAIGVPITYALKHDPKQFEIIGQGRSDLCPNMRNMSNQFVEDYYKGGGTGAYKEGNPLLGYYNNNGKAVIPYMRLLIKRRVT